MFTCRSLACRLHSTTGPCPCSPAPKPFRLSAKRSGELQALRASVGTGAHATMCSMKTVGPQTINFVLAVLVCCSAAWTAPAQDMGHSREPAVPSTQLKIQGTDGKSITLSPEQFAALPHIRVPVFNSHTKANENYSGVLL